jgi:hypothetical protein
MPKAVDFFVLKCLRWDVFDSLLWLNRWPSLFQLSFHNYLISTYPAINHDSTYRTPKNLLSWRIWEPSQSYSVGGYENLLNRTQLVDMRTFSIVLSWRIWEPSQSYSVGGYENLLNRTQLADMRTFSIVLCWWIWEPSQSYAVGGYENPLNRTQLVDMRTLSIGVVSL